MAFSVRSLARRRDTITDRKSIAQASVSSSSAVLRLAGSTRVLRIPVQDSGARTLRQLRTASMRASDALSASSPAPEGRICTNAEKARAPKSALSITYASARWVMDASSTSICVISRSLPSISDSAGPDASSVRSLSRSRTCFSWDSRSRASRRRARTPGRWPRCTSPGARRAGRGLEDHVRAHHTMASATSWDSAVPVTSGSSASASGEIPWSRSTRSFRTMA